MCLFLLRFPCALWVAFGTTVPHFVRVCVLFSCVSTVVCVLGWRPQSLSVSFWGVGHFVCACVGSKRKRKSRFCLRLLAAAFLYMCSQPCPPPPSDAPIRGSGASRWLLPCKANLPRVLTATDTGGAAERHRLWLLRSRPAGRTRGRRRRGSWLRRRRPSSAAQLPP